VRLGAVIGTFVVLSAGHVVGKLLAICASAVMARTIGPAALGVFATAVTLFGYVLILSNWGTDAIGIRRIAIAPEQAPNVLRSVPWVRLAFGAPAAVAVLLGVTAAGWDLGTSIPFSLAVVAFAFRADWVLLATGRATAVSLSAILREGAFLLSVVLLLPARATAKSAAWCYFLADALWAITTQVFAWFGRIRQSRHEMSLLPGLIREGWPMVVTATMSLTYNKFDTPLLAWLRSANEAGVYWAAYSVIFAAMGFSAMLSRSALPEMARSTAGRSTSPTPQLAFLLISAMSAGGLAAVVIFGMADPIMRRLFGQQFGGGAAPLRLLAMCLPMSFASGILLNRLVAEGRQHSLAVGASAAALVNVLLNLVLIPSRGMEGAAVATLVSEATLLSAGLVGLGWSKVAATTSVLGGWILLSVFATVATLPAIVDQRGLALTVIMVCAFSALISVPLARAWIARAR
jgi:O-antigen/teichoic acid export membrane protein